MSQRNEHANALIELWEIVLRYRWRFVLPAFVVCALVLGASLLLPRTYKAVGIFERRTDMVLTEMTNRRGATQSFQNPRDSINEEITGAPAINRLLKQIEPRLTELGLIHNRLDLDILREDLMRRVVVHWDISNSQIDRIRVEYIGADPQLASLAVNGLIENYMRSAKDQMTARLAESAAFFKSEAQRSKAAIEQLEAKVLDFEIEHGDMLPENPNNIQTRLVDAQEKLAEITAARDAAATRVDALTRALKDVPETVPTLIQGQNPERVRLTELRRKSQDQLNDRLNVQKMTEAHPEVIALHEQIASLDQQIAALPEEVITEKQYQVNPRRGELQLQLTTAISEQQALTQQAAAHQRELDKINAAIENMFAIRSTHRKLTRQQDEAQRQLAFWEDNLRQVEMATAAESGKRGIEMTFVQPASPNLRPVSPNFAQVVMAALGLGLMVGGLAVFLAYRTDETFAHGEQLTSHFDIPLFGTVSELITRRHRRIRRIRRMILYPTNALAMATVIIAIAAALYVDLEKPHAAETSPTTTATSGE